MKYYEYTWKFIYAHENRETILSDMDNDYWELVCIETPIDHPVAEHRTPARMTFRRSIRNL